MRVIVPETKRIINLAKHGIDLADFAAGFSWHRYVAFAAKPSRTGRTRDIYIGRLGGRLVTAVVSPLGSEALAVISIRTASVKERDFHDAEI